MKIIIGIMYCKRLLEIIPQKELNGKWLLWLWRVIFYSYIKSIDVPTLVIHGSIDPLFPLAAGQDIAENIVNAKLEIIEGMGHETPPALNSQIATLIITHLKQNQV